MASQRPAPSRLRAASKARTAGGRPDRRIAETKSVAERPTAAARYVAGTTVGSIIAALIASHSHRNEASGPGAVHHLHPVHQPGGDDPGGERERRQRGRYAKGARQRARDRIFDPGADAGEESGREGVGAEHLRRQPGLGLDQRVIRLGEGLDRERAAGLGRDRLEPADGEPRRNVLVEPSVRPEAPGCGARRSREWDRPRRGLRRARGRRSRPRSAPAASHPAR